MLVVLSGGVPFAVSLTKYTGMNFRMNRLKGWKSS